MHASSVPRQIKARVGALDSATVQIAVTQPRRTAATAPVTPPRAPLRRSARLGQRLGILRRRRRRRTLGRVRNHCGAGHRGLGTLMRHDLLGAQALAIAP
jgi:hypothetical protein